MSDERGRPTRRDQDGAPNMAGGGTPGDRDSPPGRAAQRTSLPERTPPVRHPSRRLTAAVYCEINGRPVEIEPLELSTAGLFVETPTPLSVDSEIEVFLRIGEMRFAASGHVVQSVSVEQASAKRRKPGYGLLFTNVDDAARAQLRRGIQSLVVQRASNSRAPQPVVLNKAPANQVRPQPSASAVNSQRPIAPPFPPGQPIAPAFPPVQTSARPLAQPIAPAFPPAQPSAQPPAIDPQEKTVLDRLRAEVRDIDSKPPWVVLGISQGAEPAQAKAAFFDASKRYHPHLFARYAAPEIKQVVTELFIAHKRAYTMMVKTAQRAAQAVDPNPLRRGNPSKQPSGSK